MEALCFCVTNDRCENYLILLSSFPHSVTMHFLSACVLTTSLLMASFLVNASVSKSFKDCSHFFYMQTPPAGMTGSGLRRICQKYANKVRYATLYDSSRRLPVYSAFIFKKSDGKRRVDTPWMYEPQVGRTTLLGLLWATENLVMH